MTDTTDFWFSERDDAIVSLELLAKELQVVSNDPYHWKWVIIALHNALQGFMVLALQGTNGLNALNEKSKKEQIDWYNSLNTNTELKYATPWLDYLKNLYAKIKDPKHMVYFSETDTVIFKPTQENDRSLNLLNDLRSDFIHFKPRRDLQVCIQSYIKILQGCIPILKFLALDVPQINVQLERNNSKSKITMLMNLPTASCGVSEVKTASFARFAPVLLDYPALVHISE